MRIDPKNPKWDGRDRFVLGKGHACPTLYAILSDLGYIQEKELFTLRGIGSCLQGQPDCRKTAGVDISSGSLGHSLSLANGMAMGEKLKGTDCRVFDVMGDGELQEGEIWEAAMSAAHYKLDNIVAVIDNNGMQIDGLNSEVMNLGDLRAKWSAFGWEVFVVKDGNNIKELLECLKGMNFNNLKPKVIIAKTVKGKGLSFAEGKVEWHAKVPNDEEYEQAMRELGG
jgi:transketolase